MSGDGAVSGSRDLPDDLAVIYGDGNGLIVAGCRVIGSRDLLDAMVRIELVDASGQPVAVEMPARVMRALAVAVQSVAIVAMHGGAA